MIKVKHIFFNILCILGVAMIAIIVHAIMPSPGASINEASFDSILVQNFGFPVVACMYFIILYLHIFIVIRYFGARTAISNQEIGWRYGLSFGLIYLVGMQEVVVSASPIHHYGIDFVLYQLFMGLGDAIPAIILCVLIGHFTLKSATADKLEGKRSIKKNIFTVGVISVLFIIERVMGYVLGYIDSDLSQYPLPVLIWTLIFGVTLGGAYILIRPIYRSKNGGLIAFQSAVLSLGINWIWFNSFIGLILKDSIGQMLLRSGIDVIVIFVGILIINYCNPSCSSM